MPVMDPMTAPISRFRLTTRSRISKATTAAPMKAPTPPAANFSRPKGCSRAQATASKAIKKRRMKTKSIKDLHQAGALANRYKDSEPNSDCASDARDPDCLSRSDMKDERLLRRLPTPVGGLSKRGKYIPATRCRKSRRGASRLSHQ